jgi:hypothetical protein
MGSDELLDDVLNLLHQRGRVTYRCVGVVTAG